MPSCVRVCEEEEKIIRMGRVRQHIAFSQEKSKLYRQRIYFFRIGWLEVWWVMGNWSLNPTEPSIWSAINLPFLSLFIYSSSHLSILACGQRAISLCGPDDLEQFPLQFISQPTTYLVKQHPASQGRATHPSKPLTANHMLLFSLLKFFCLSKFQFSPGVMQPFLPSIP